MFSRANGINTAGEVVGFCGLKRDGAESRAFVWSGDTGMIDIGTLGGLYVQDYAINDAGYITGASQTLGWSPIVTTDAFIYQFPRPPYPPNQRMADLGSLGGLTSYGLAINDYNHVVGYSIIKPNNPRVHAFLHDGTRMIDLGSLGNDSVALGINKLDQVVGYSYLPAIGDGAPQQVAFLWARTPTSVTGKMVNLNTLVDQTGRNYLLISRGSD